MVTGVKCVILISLIVLGLVHVYQSDFFNRDDSAKSIAWSSAFECGFLAHSVVFNSFSRGFFILLVFFVIFDLEISLLLNIGYVSELYKSFLHYLFFLFFVCFGFLAEVENGFVKWEY